MNPTYKKDWQDTRDKFEAWWESRNTGAPLMWVVSRRDHPTAPPQRETPYAAPEQQYLDVEQIPLRHRNFCRQHVFHAQAFPNLSVDLGAGSLALYLGSAPKFHWDTVWFTKTVRDGWASAPRLEFDPENFWYRKHLSMLDQAKTLSGEDYLVNIPDIVENIDILSALRGPQDMCYDLVDEPEEVEARIGQLDDIYFNYYDSMYDRIKCADGSSSYTAFNIWGGGKVAKVQCDFAALMDPGRFRRFIQPSLARQCARLDHAIYHLDGPDAVRHVDTLMEIDALAGIQWTSGAGNVDGLDEKWFAPIYDKVRRAGKSLLLYAIDGGVDTWLGKIDVLVGRYGTAGLYIQFPVMKEADAQKLLEYAQRHWK